MTFNILYFLSLFFFFCSIYVLHLKNNNLPSILLYFIIPITVAYTSLILLDILFESTDETADDIFDYIELQYYESIKDTGYYTIFPPFIIFILIFSILLYYQNF